jgi:threonine synthase
MLDRPAPLNSRLAGMRCLRCGRITPIGDCFEGCAACLAAGMPASVALEYRDLPDRIDPIAEWLVYPKHIGLGEGSTALVELRTLAGELGLGRLHLKNEGANPTGSHKDRMSCLVVQRALDIGASTVAAASSGNAGVSLAAYSARAGLACAIVTTPAMNANWRRAIEMYGATLLAAETADERWQVVAKRVHAGDWYPATNYLVPAIGSNPFGVDGYRAIALEIAKELMDDPPTDILVPTSRADLLWGIARGYADMQRVGIVDRKPRIHAVEPIPRLTRVLAGADYRSHFEGASKLVSIGGSTVTFQALDALHLCRGTAVVANEEEALDDQRRLARSGFYLELSSVAALTGLRRLLASGAIKSGARVILIATSSGWSEEGEIAEPIARVAP